MEAQEQINALKAEIYDLGKALQNYSLVLQKIGKECNNAETIDGILDYIQELKKPA